MTIIRHLVRFVVAAIVLLVIGFIMPGFSIQGFWTALLAAIVIAAIGWIVETFFGDNISPYARGIVGFLVSAVVIYVAQFVVPNMEVTILGALLAALIIGIVDMFIPAMARFGQRQGDKASE